MKPADKECAQSCADWLGKQRSAASIACRDLYIVSDAEKDKPFKSAI